MDKPTISVQTYEQIFNLLTAGLVRDGVIGKTCEFKITSLLILVKQSIDQKKLFWQLLQNHIERGSASKVDLSLVPTYFRQLNKELWILVGNNNHFTIETEEPLTRIRVTYPEVAVKCLIALTLLSLGEIEDLTSVVQLKQSKESGTVYYFQTHMSQSPYLCIVLGQTKKVVHSYGVLEGIVDVFPVRKIVDLADKSWGILGYLPLPNKLQPNLDFTDELKLFNSKIGKYNLEDYEIALSLLQRFDERFWDGVVDLNFVRYRVNPTVISAFSAYFTTAFIHAEGKDLRAIEFHSDWKAEFEEYLKYLSGQPNTMLNLIDFEANFRFADYIQDRVLGLKLLNAFFSNLDNIDMTKSQVISLRQPIINFLNSL